VASREAQAKLAVQYGWDGNPRWALFRGDELKASGDRCPDPRALATTLEAEGPALLQLLQKVVDAQPEHLAARRARYELLLRRMPDARLEAALCQEAIRLRQPLEFDPKAPWKPDPDLWADAAQQVLPKLEEELRSWPGRVSLWNAWVSWARFSPRQPSIVNLAQGLPYWNPLGDWRAGLPYSVQRAVAAELNRQGNFAVMRDWFRAAWDTLDHRPLSALRRGEREWLQEQRREEETAIFQPLRDALRGLGCTAEQAELERTFSEMVGREVSGRR
jgi:hypothetical protein